MSEKQESAEDFALRIYAKIWEKIRARFDENTNALLRQLREAAALDAAAPEEEKR